MKAELGNQLTNLQDRFADHRTTTRDRIIRGASQLFTRHGYEGTSTDAIAESAEVKPAALYREFESKQDILYSFLEQVYEGFYEDMDVALSAADSPAEKLARLAWAHTWIQLSSGPIASAPSMFSVGQLLTSLSTERATRLRALARAHGDQLRTIIADGSRRGEFNVPHPGSAALAVATYCEFSPLWFRDGGELSAAEVAHDHAIYALRLVAAAIPDPESFVERAISVERAEGNPR